MANVQSRRWLVTINNPGDKGLSHDAIKDIVAHGTAPVYWCMCDEVGDECETLHTHLYFVWKSPVRFDTIRKMFDCSHCDKPNGTSPECRAYGVSQKEIAAFVGVHPSTICRELRRAQIILLNSDLTTRVAYSAAIAQQKADFAQTSKGRPLKIGYNYAYLEALQRHILNNYSPYAAIQKERRNTAFSVSAPTLYRYIQMGLFTQITYSHLPRAKKKKHKGKIHRQNKTNLNHRSIEMRCKAIMHRSDFGHWELDSVIGKAKGHGESVLVLTERKTRIEIILRPKDKTAAETTRCLRYLKHIFGRDYNKIFKTITCDNGSEFADQQAFESVGSMFFYCHPSCPSERGSNENANILIRRKLPKGQTMKKVTQKRATHIQHWLNDYPRHIFDGKTAFEMFMQDLPALGLHNEKRVINFFDPHT